MNIGIDLGTFNSAAAVAIGRGQTIMVESKRGESRYGKNFPSFVLFDHNGKKQAVGKSAKEELSTNPDLVIWGVKRLVGLSYEAAEEKGELKRFQYNIERGPGGAILIKVGEERFTPSHILECILREIKEDAENPRANPMLGGQIEKAVISVPAYFDGTRTGPIKDAAKNAGFGKVETIAEPTAAALVYGLELAREANVLTFDMGAGTLDVTIMLFLYEGGELISSELCTSGDEALGGIDMDDILTNHVIDKYKLSEIREGSSKMAALKEEIERTKIRLSSRETAPLDLPLQTVDLTRGELENVLNDPKYSPRPEERKSLLEKCRGPIRVALNQAGLEANQLDHVLFVGGPTHMPCVRATVKDELERLGARRDLLAELETWEEKALPVNPMECVAKGACLKAGGVVEPTTRTDPNGYGTIIDHDRFWPIIPVNSDYPITGAGTIEHRNPEALRVPISLVTKRAYDEDGDTLYKYCYLGDYDCYIRSTGESPLIDITMELTDDKVLITTFTHRQTHESVTFEELNELKGTEITLKEVPLEPPPPAPPEPPEPPPRRPRRHWTQEQLDKALHVAQMLVDDFAERSQDEKVTKKKTELLRIIGDAPDPRRDSNRIMNRMLELLNALHNASEISETDFSNYKEELREI